MADTDLAEGQDNQEGEDRPDWLPENFKTPEDLASSYRESQRKITEEATARRNLEDLVVSQQAQLEQWQAQATQAAEPEQPWDEWYANDPIATQKAMAEQAAQAQVGQYAQAANKQLQDLTIAQAKLTADYAYRQLEQERGPLTDEMQAAMRDVFAEHPNLLTEDVVADGEKLKKTLSLAADIAERKVGPQTPRESSADLMRTMKLGAQSANGAGGHLSPADENAQRWQEIANAPSGTLGL